MVVITVITEIVNSTPMHFHEPSILLVDTNVYNDNYVLLQDSETSFEMKTTKCCVF